jgi:hypothetical protein
MVHSDFLLIGFGFLSTYYLNNYHQYLMEDQLKKNVARIDHLYMMVDVSMLANVDNLPSNNDEIYLPQAMKYFYDQFVSFSRC